MQNAIGWRNDKSLDICETISTTSLVSYIPFMSPQQPFFIWLLQRSVCNTCDYSNPKVLFILCCTLYGFCIYVKTTKEKNINTKTSWPGDMKQTSPKPKSEHTPSGTFANSLSTWPLYSISELIGKCNLYITPLIWHVWLVDWFNCHQTSTSIRSFETLLSLYVEFYNHLQHGRFQLSNQE